MQRAARRRKTRQLEQVFAALQGDHSHPFAQEIYRRVHKRLPRIRLATVYRNLHSLVEEGKIRTLLLDGQGARYDPETSEHDHFAREARLRRRDAQRDGPWNVSGLCRSTSAFSARAAGGTPSPDEGPGVATAVRVVHK